MACAPLSKTRHSLEGRLGHTAVYSQNAEPGLTGALSFRVECTYVVPYFLFVYLLIYLFVSLFYYLF